LIEEVKISLLYLRILKMKIMEPSWCSN